MNRRRKRVLSNTGNFFIFVGPTIFVFSCVLIIPMFYGVYLTFSDYTPIMGVSNFVGFKNYIAAITDKMFFLQFTKTISYVFFSTIFCNLLAFILAYLLTTKLILQNVVRTGFFTPNLIGGVILGYIWKFIFSNVLTQIGSRLGYAPLSNSFLTHPDRAILAMIIVTVWQYSGYMMMIYIAGFISIPQEIFEAAELDYATGIRKVINITIPLMIPSFIICFFLSISRCFMTYDLNLTLTNGGPYGSTRLVSMYIYQKAFQSNQYAIGQSEAFILFFVVAAVAVSQVLLTKKFEVES